MADKVYTPQQAAMMVLAKAQELFKLSPLAKGEWDKIEHKLEGEGYSKKTADKINGSIKAKMGKSEDMEMSEKNPDEKQDAELGEKVEHEVEAHESENPEAEKQEHREKGSYKLAKFMGKMEMKKSQKAAPEMDKGEHQPHPGPTSAVPAYAAANQATAEKQLGSPEGEQGRQQRNAQMMQGQAAQTKNPHEQKLDQIHQMSKPNLGKGM